MRYFDHDTTASADDKIIALRMMHGSQAVDCYWALLEKIYADEAPLNLSETNAETQSVCFRLGVGYEDLKRYVSYMIEIDLLEATDDADTVTSARAMQKIADYREKCETARQNGKKGGRKPRRKPTANRVGTNPKPSGNQDAKLIEEKRVVGLDKPNQTTTAGADAGGEGPAPRPCGKAERDMIEQNRLMAEFASDAVPCPDHLRQGGAA